MNYSGPSAGPGPVNILWSNDAIRLKFSGHKVDIMLRVYSKYQNNRLRRVPWNASTHFANILTVIRKWYKSPSTGASAITSTIIFRFFYKSLRAFAVLWSRCIQHFKLISLRILTLYLKHASASIYIYIFFFSLKYLVNLNDFKHNLSLSISWITR